MVCRLSIYSNSTSHVLWLVRSSNTILKVGTLRMIQANFGWNWPNTFSGEDFKNNLPWSDRQWRLTQDDGNTSYDPLNLFLLVYCLGEKEHNKMSLMIPLHICSMSTKTNQVDKQEVGIWRVHKRFPQYGIPINSCWEKYLGRTEGQTYGQR